MFVCPLTRLPAHIYTIGFLLLLLSETDQWLINRGWLSLPGTVIFLVMVFPFVFLLAGVELISRPATSRTMTVFYRNRLIILPFGAIVLLALILALHPTAFWGNGATKILVAPTSFFVFLSAMLLPLFKFIKRGFRIYILLALGVLLITVSIDTIMPGLFSKLNTRAAGLARNPNQAAYLIVLMSAVVLRYDRAKLFDIGLLIVSGIAVFATLSRSGLVLFGLVVVGYLFFTFRLTHPNPKRVMRLIVNLAILAFLLLLGMQILLQETSFLTGAPAQQQRLALFTGKNSFFASDLSDKVDSPDVRFVLLKEGLKLVDESPLIGHGSGYTSTLSKRFHNLYLEQWINNGLLGMLSYLALLFFAGLLFYTRRFPAGLIFITIVAVYSLFSHNILENRAFLILFGMLCTISLINYDTMQSTT